MDKALDSVPQTDSSPLNVSLWQVVVSIAFIQFMWSLLLQLENFAFYIYPHATKSTFAFLLRLPAIISEFMVLAWFISLLKCWELLPHSQWIPL